MGRWQVGVYDARGTYVSTTDRTFLFRFLAEREKRKIENVAPPFMVEYEGRLTPLTNYIVERTDG